MTVSPPILLLIDDDQDMRASLSRLLSLRFTVLSATSAEEALRVLREPASVDLILSDIMMPGMGAAGLLPQLPASLRARTVLMTGSDDHVVTRKVIQDAQMPVVHKPFRLTDLLNTLLSLLPAPAAPAPA